MVQPPPVPSYNNNYNNDVDEGHSVSKGRGFTSFSPDDNGKCVLSFFGENLKVMCLEPQAMGIY